MERKNQSILYLFLGKVLKTLRERRNQRRRARIENIPLPIIRNPVEINNPIVVSGNLPTGEGLRRSDDYCEVPNWNTPMDGTRLSTFTAQTEA